MQRVSDLFLTILSELDDKVLLPNNHESYNLQENGNSQVMKERENLH